MYASLLVVPEFLVNVDCLLGDFLSILSEIERNYLLVFRQIVSHSR